MFTKMKTLTASLLIVGLSFAVAAPVYADEKPIEIRTDTATRATIDSEKSETKALSQDERTSVYNSARSYIQTLKESKNSERLAKYWESRSQILEQEVESITLHVLDIEAEAEQALAAYEEYRKVLVQHIRGSNRNGLDSLNNEVIALIQGPEKMKEKGNNDRMEVKVEELLSEITRQMKINEEAAQKLLEEATKKKEEAIQLLEEAKTTLETMKTEEKAATQKYETAMENWDRVWTGIPDTISGTATTSIGNEILNQAITDEWAQYLAELEALDIEIPTDKDLSNVNNFPKGLEPFPAVSIDNSGGVAYYKNMVIPTKEALERTNKAIGLLNQPFNPKGDGTDGWSCQALVSDVTFGKKDVSLTALYEDSGKQNSNLHDTTVGDLVFFADPSSGIHHAGVYIFGDMVVSASASNNAVTVENMTVDAIGSVRPSTNDMFNTPAPEPMPNSLPWNCGGLDFGDVDEKGDAWVTPFKEGEYKVGTKFSNDTKFLEFLTGTENSPVRAPFDGKVIAIKELAKDNNEVTIQHSQTFSTKVSGIVKPAVAEGANITGGTVLGVASKVGSSNKDQFSVRLTLLADGAPSDPYPLFFPERISSGSGGGNGQYANGMIPASALCKLSMGGLLRCDAARAFEIMNAAYFAEFGTNISITDTYRSYEGQVRCRQQKGSLCATPGKSNHGWGMATDLGGGINSFGTPQHKWMAANAPRFGWEHPQWARQGGVNPEAWHFEFRAGM